MQRLFWRQRIRFSPVLWAQQCDSRVEVPIVAQNADRIESPWDTIQKNLRRTSPLVKSVIGAPSNHAERGPSSRRAFSGHQLMWCRSMRKEIPNASANRTSGSFEGFQVSDKAVTRPLPSVGKGDKREDRILCEFSGAVKGGLKGLPIG